jgi:hypothetical protein
LDRPVNTPLNLEIFERAKDKACETYLWHMKMDDGYISRANFEILLDDFILNLLSLIIMDTLDSMENYVFGSICDEKNKDFRYEWPFSFDLDRYLEFRAKMGLRTQGVKQQIKDSPHRQGGV